MTEVLVTGGTGVLGAATVARLASAGHQVRVLTHRQHSVVPPGVESVQGDLASGEGLDKVVAGGDLVIHAASDSSDPWSTDVGGTFRLLSALAGRASSTRIVYVSIVGVDRSTLPYYLAKRAAERHVQDSGIAWDIIRATQFHNFAASSLESLIDDSGAITVPAGVSLQSVDVNEVADRVVALAEATPANRIVLFGGPQVLTLEEMAVAYQQTRGRSGAVHIAAVNNPVMGAWRSGEQLAPDHADGATTWQEFLDHRYSLGRA